MSKIIRLEAENVKRLRAVEISPKGNVVVIGGNNAQGKTSLLDSIAMALSGREVPVQPVRAGEDRARIILETEDLVIKRTFTAAGGMSLVIENREGLRYASPQAVLDKLTGKLTFDPMAFLRMDSHQQLDALKRLVGLDMSEMEAKRKTLYDQRTMRNRDLALARTQAEAKPHFPEAPEAPVDTVALVAELEQVNAHNAKKVALELQESEAQDASTAKNHEVCDLRLEVQRLEEKLNRSKEELTKQSEVLRALQAAHEEKRAALAAFTVLDDSEIKAKLAGAARTNEQVQANHLRADGLAAVAKKKAEVDAITAQIEAIDNDKAKQLAAAKFPVAGLSFDEKGVLYNGVPFEQASGAEQLRVSVAMAAALNPKLRVMLVRDGSLLDDDNLALLRKLAAEYDVQVWIEMVGKDERVQVVIEDGAVAEVRDAEDRPAEGALPDATVPFKFE